MPAPDAESLMRSRYAAYVLGRDDYVLATWHPDTRPSVLTPETPPPKWLGLDVKSHRQEGVSATVEFVARCKVNGRAQRMHEISRFVFEQGCWWYVDGVFPGDG